MCAGDDIDRHPLRLGNDPSYHTKQRVVQASRIPRLSGPLEARAATLFRR